ncbi:MAG: PQQ-dependent catabolism-associated beta-propeller protein [Gammaproteobacteria bacterium]|nr:PQQ-dependent catabolism-associated beta-propeller protein [Gammaproteobacteria bacterium]
MKGTAVKFFAPALLLCVAANCAAAPTNRLFVTNENSDNVSVIDLATNKVTATVDIGKRPRGIGRAPDGSAIYVAVSNENSIAVLDPQSLKVLRKFHCGEDPETFAVHPNGNIYISNENDAMASIYDPATGKLIQEVKVGNEPEGVAISPDGKRAIVTSESSNLIHILAIPEYKITANVLVGARPRAATFNRDGSIVYATSEIGAEVKKIEASTGKIIGHVPLADDKAKPKDILISRDGTKLYVAGGRANRVFVIDEKSLAVLHEIPVGKRVWGLAMNRDGSRIYSTDGASNQVSVIDTKENKAIAQIPVGDAPWGVAIDD